MCSVSSTRPNRTSRTGSRRSTRHRLRPASIGQVHRAKLCDGTVVAIKIQRPGIPDQIENDLAILLSMADRIEAVFPESRMYNPKGLVQDFATQIRKELDFTRDGRNMERMARNFRDVPGIHFPKVYWEYSSPHILVMEYVKGVRVDNVEAIKAQGCNPHDIALRGFNAYLKMIFEDGFFHGDPHPGNLLVSDIGDLVFLDFGIVGVLRPEKKQLFINLLFALTTDDVDMILKALEGFGIVVAEENREALRDDLYIMLHDFGGGDEIVQFNFGLMINELTEVMRHYNLKVPMSLMLLLKTLVMVFDVAVRLDPKFSFGEEITPYLRKLTDSNVLSAAYAKRASNSLLEAVDAAFDLPRNVNLMLRRLSTGTVRLEVVDTDLKKLQMALDRASDKIMIGLVVAGARGRLVARAAGIPAHHAKRGHVDRDPRVYRRGALRVLCDLPCHLPKTPARTVRVKTAVSFLPQVFREAVVPDPGLFAERQPGVCRACGGEDDRGNGTGFADKEFPCRRPVERNAPDRGVTLPENRQYRLGPCPGSLHRHFPPGRRRQGRPRALPRDRSAVRYGLSTAGNGRSRRSAPRSSRTGCAGCRSIRVLQATAPKG